MAMQTPTKVLRRVVLTPTTKQCLCIVCGQNIADVKNRIRLTAKAKGAEKPSALADLEQFLLSQIEEPYLTIICRSCHAKIVTANKKRSALISQFESTKKRVERSHGVLAAKRCVPTDASDGDTDSASGGGKKVAVPDPAVTDTAGSTGVLQKAAPTRRALEFPRTPSKIPRPLQVKDINKKTSVTVATQTESGSEPMAMSVASRPSVKKKHLKEVKVNRPIMYI